MTVTAPARRRWRYRARQLAWAGVDFLFTPACGGCGRPGHRWCRACQAAVENLAAPVCARCGYPRGAGAPCRLCHGPAGAHTLDPLAGLRSAAFFDGPLQHALHQLKYKRDIILADSLAHPLAQAWSLYQLPAGTVVPVPLSAQRRRERGYNQAELLARAFAELCGLPYEPRAAVRTRHTASQVGLPGAARRANVRGAFQAQPERAAGAVIILVDDVCTTGATLAACAEALRASGAAAVWGLTLGRARIGQAGYIEPSLAGKPRRPNRAP